jgi:glucosamine-6-phosphate deaminase
MSRKLSSIAPDWWDYTTLDTDIIKEAAQLTAEKMLKLSRPGFKVVF